jgi:hypothetical protein
VSCIKQFWRANHIRVSNSCALVQVWRKQQATCNQPDNRSASQPTPNPQGCCRVVVLSLSPPTNQAHQSISINHKQATDQTKATVSYEAKQRPTGFISLNQKTCLHSQPVNAKAVPSQVWLYVPVIVGLAPAVHALQRLLGSVMCQPQPLATMRHK